MSDTSLSGFKRTARVTEMVSEENLGKSLVLMGWCHKQRHLGSLIFITLRDRTGELQLLIGEEASEDLREIASKVRSEFVLAVKGVLQRRSSPNPKHPTGNYELLVSELRILSTSATTPFYIEDGLDANETLRLKHRYLDLRRPELLNKLMLRSKFMNATTAYFEKEGFINVETPILGKSTPEGARDYLVPSRVFQGSFFALPQSPQLYKQLLQVAGVDRYFQIARCFRDEDLRADRQPEFTQIDLEMSFVDIDDVLEMAESYVQNLFKVMRGQDLPRPFKHMTYSEVMRRYGSDKPDLRFGMEIQDLSDFAKTLDFPVFSEALANGGHVSVIVVPQASSFSNKDISKLVDFVKTYKAKGLAWYSTASANKKARSSFMKFLSEEAIHLLESTLSLKEDELVLFVADKCSVVQAALGALRCHLARKLDLIDPNAVEILWVTDFPLLEWDEESGRFFASHHPFTAPMDEDIQYLDTDPARVRAKAYDMVLNGQEMGGGSIRIHTEAIQQKMLKLLGFTEERANESFGFLLEAFKYGVPPHGGLAFGLDRWVMFFAGTENIRDVIAFPKVQSSACLMTEAPGMVSELQLEELGLQDANFNLKDQPDVE